MIKQYEAKPGVQVGDALTEMYFRVLHGDMSVMVFNGVTITMKGKDKESMIYEI